MSVSVIQVDAKMYKWQDANGKRHFTDNPSKVPQEYRESNDLSRHEGNLLLLKKQRKTKVDKCVIDQIIKKYEDQPKLIEIFARAETQASIKEQLKGLPESFQKGIGEIGMFCMPNNVKNQMTKQFDDYKRRAYDSDAKANLHNIFLACMAFWADTGSSKRCTTSIAKNKIYGFVQSPDVEVFIKKFTKSDFELYSKHNDSPKTWKMNANGVISKVLGFKFSKDR